MTVKPKPDIMISYPIEIIGPHKCTRVSYGTEWQTKFQYWKKLRDLTHVCDLRSRVYIYGSCLLLCMHEILFHMLYVTLFYLPLRMQIGIKVIYSHNTLLFKEKVHFSSYQNIHKPKSVTFCFDGTRSQIILCFNTKGKYTVVN